jgi:hypothetical protein
MEVTPEYVLNIMQSKLDWMNTMTDWSDMELSSLLTWYWMALKDCAEYFWFDRDEYWVKEMINE